eukprot:11980032-Alexandrium_andersonii.AAC.1
MSASLVGSEMCIRDRPWLLAGPGSGFVGMSGHGVLGVIAGSVGVGVVTVSYTHLTLPTICSV